MITNTVSDMRLELARHLADQRFTSVNREASMTSLVGAKTIELCGVNFIADQEVLFGKLNHDYLKREEQWYQSMSCSVDDFPGGAPAVWEAIASRDGLVNSNYGYLIRHSDNGYQFDHVVNELRRNPESRRAVMIYTRPSMWVDYNKGGRSDFVCTNTVQYLIRDGSVSAVVNMRSQDSHIGYKNDREWQRLTLNAVADAVGVPAGVLMWQVGSLHVYQRDFYLVDHFIKTREVNITKAQYRELYPTSPYNE